MTLVSIIIPSHNRPVLLREAVASVHQQTYGDWEVVIIDDGSQPPVDEQALCKEFGARVRVMRNAQAMRLPYARNQGVQAARGDVVIHLDDDDLLAPQAVETALAILESDPSLELVYLGVKGFGERSAYFNETQQRAMQNILKLANAGEGQAEVVRFGSDLFKALLQSVPMAFQRSIVYRTAWDKVSKLRRRAYMLDPDITDEDQAMLRIQPPLRDSEWALYAAASCRTALLTTPVYLQRCDGQGYVSQPAQKERSIHSSIDIKAHLFAASKEFQDFKPWAEEIKKSFSLAFFNQSYSYFQNGKRLAAYKALINALRIRPAAAYLRFALRMLLPSDGITG